MIWPLVLGWSAPVVLVQMGSDLEVSLLVEPDRAGLGPAEGQRDALLRMPWPPRVSRAAACRPTGRLNHPV